MGKYVIGTDFGTLSARSILVELTSGRIIAEAIYKYPHAVLTYNDFALKSNKDTALQHPQDYINAISETVGSLLSDTGIAPKDVQGLGIDFTASTIMPIKADGTPLCFTDTYRNNPHAYVKLWKHHGANREADEITQKAQELNCSWLSDLGGKISSEWMFPKILETAKEAPEVYKDTDRFLEAGEWICMMLTGNEVRSSCMAGYKAQWSKENGYPDNDFWALFGDEFANIIGTKVSENVRAPFNIYGKISSEGHKLTGLEEGTVVSIPLIDAHAALPAAGIVAPGKLMMIAGTSCCHIVLSDKDIKISGICGKVEDGIIPGLFAYEAGQSCVGDLFDWFVKNCVPESYYNKAAELKMSIFDYLTHLASSLDIKSSKLLVLDYWTGNRTPYADFDLSGMILGLTLETRPEHIYKALLEGCAFGTKAIIDIFEENGIMINEIVASGGISHKNDLFMQICSDVTGKKISVVTSDQSAAKGSAITASVACGYFKDINEAVGVMGEKCSKLFDPKPQNSERYSKLYKEYRVLSEYFACGKNDVMKRIKEI